MTNYLVPGSAWDHNNPRLRLGAPALTVIRRWSVQARQSLALVSSQAEPGN